MVLLFACEVTWRGERHLLLISSPFSRKAEYKTDFHIVFRIALTLSTGDPAEVVLFDSLCGSYVYMFGSYQHLVSVSL